MPLIYLKFKPQDGTISWVGPFDDDDEAIRWAIQSHEFPEDYLNWEIVYVENEEAINDLVWGTGE